MSPEPDPEAEVVWARLQLPMVVGTFVDFVLALIEEHPDLKIRNPRHNPNVVEPNVVELYTPGPGAP